MVPCRAQWGHGLDEWAVGEARSRALFTRVRGREVLRTSCERRSRKFGLLSTPPVLSPGGPPTLGSGHGAQPSQRRCPSALGALLRVPDCPSRSGPLPA